MPIITTKKAVDVSLIKAKMSPSVLEKIENYCQWAGIYDLGYFIEKAATELLNRDPEWNIHIQQQTEEVEN